MLHATETVTEKLCRHVYANGVSWCVFETLAVYVCLAIICSLAAEDVTISKLVTYHNVTENEHLATLLLLCLSPNCHLHMKKHGPRGNRGERQGDMWKCQEKTAYRKKTSEMMLANEISTVNVYLDNDIFLSLHNVTITLHLSAGKLHSNVRRLGSGCGCCVVTELWPIFRSCDTW